MKEATLKKLHQYMVDVLMEIDRICEKYSLTYFIIGGTLLGAVRHNGFIPWDDDLDIVMPRTDYEKFSEICKDELDNRFYLHCIENDPDYPMPMPKVKIQNTVFEQSTHVNSSMQKGIYVDIFPLDNANKEKSLFQSAQAVLQGSLGAIRGAKLGIYNKREFSPINRLAYMLLHNFSNVTLEKWQRRIQKWNKNEHSEYFVNFASGYGYRKQTIKKSVYYPVRKLEFEGKLFSAPNDYDFFLRRIYGDKYMELPPPEKRVTHNPVRLSFDTSGPDEILDD